MSHNVLLSVLLLWAPITGCRKPVYFPADSLAQKAKEVQAAGAYDTDGDGRADFFTYANASGRIEL